MSQLSPDARLPSLRSELKILPGMREVNGLKSWLIFDPVRHKYFQVDEKSHAMLMHWHSGTAEKIMACTKRSDITLEGIEALLRFLWSSALTTSPPNGDNSTYTNHASNKKRHWVMQLLHSYLFFIIPLVRPDRFLKRTEFFTRIFFTRTWFSLMVVVALLGVYLTSRQWDQFVHTFSHFFSLQGLMYYAVALIFVKLAHEAGHAYAATRYGCTVLSMGIAFIVMFPVLYTDTTDSWKLTSRKQRLVISAAGVAVELSIAAIATFIWAFSAEGALRSAAFFIATTSWIMTLAINTNPLMRFDAYHFLSDFIGVQNLQSRSFAIGKWSLRERLFGLKEPMPEALNSKWVRGLTYFAWATWIYRFFLFLGIAIIVHAMFFKPFGTVMAVIEVLFFIGIPIMNELKQWYGRKLNIATSPRSWVTATCLGIFLLALFIPWQTTVRIPAILEPSQSADIFAPADARIATLNVQQGDIVTQGDIVMSFESDQISRQTLLVQREIDLRVALLNRIASDSSDLEQKIVLESELNSLKEELTGLQTTQERLTITAPFSGTVGVIDHALHVDRWTSEGQFLVTLNTQGNAKIRGFIERANLGRVSNGSDAVFIPEIPELEKINGHIELVDSANIDELNIPALASHYGGRIAASTNDSKIEPLQSWYHVNIDVPAYSGSVLQERRGLVLAQGDPESIAARIARRLFYVVLREVVI